MSTIQEMDQWGERVPFSCPDCGGALWHLEDRPRPRYRCHLGHGFTEGTLIAGQADATAQALIVALRTMEERIKLLRRLEEETGPSRSTRGYVERADELARHADRLRHLILATQQHEAYPPPAGDRAPASS